jgi:isopenicillin N synthase-like dioxygenase
MLSRISNYILKATLHRVIDIGDDRFSSPFFFEPHYAAVIPSSIMDLDSLKAITTEDNSGRIASEDQKQYEQMLYGDYLVDKIMSYCLSYQGLFKGKRSDLNKSQ